jgi:hypothetical protein
MLLMLGNLVLNSLILYGLTNSKMLLTFLSIILNGIKKNIVNLNGGCTLKINL